ncbi:MAG TPA: HdeD family acid-resistance protein [Polyangiaceae bacterium]|nr:HdeD family acid-resistance protein [Polyangiaceae bacterium]
MVARVHEITSSMESAARQAGWTVALRGILAVIFGIIALRSPNIIAGAFVIVFAIYAFADGVLDFAIAAEMGRAGRSWGWHAFEGLASVALGVIALLYPGVTLVTVILLVGLRAIIMGILEVVAAFSWEGAESRWLLGITGVLSIMLGILLLGSPVAGGVVILWTIGVYAIVFGVMLFAVGLRMLSVERRQDRQDQLDRPAASAG